MALIFLYLTANQFIPSQTVTHLIPPFSLSLSLSLSKTQTHNTPLFQTCQSQPCVRACTHVHEWECVCVREREREREGERWGLIVFLCLSGRLQITDAKRLLRFQAGKDRQNGLIKVLGQLGTTRTTRGIDHSRWPWGIRQRNRRVGPARRSGECLVGCGAWWWQLPLQIVSRKARSSGKAGGSGKGTRYCCVRIQDHGEHPERNLVKRHLEFVASLSFPFPGSHCCLKLFQLDPGLYVWTWKVQEQWQL